MKASIQDLLLQARGIIAIHEGTTSELGRATGHEGWCAYQNAHRWIKGECKPSGEDVMAIQDWVEKKLRIIRKSVKKRNAFDKAIKEIGR